MKIGFDTKRVALVVLVSVLVLLTLGVGTAFASNSAKPGDILFPIDIASEQVLLAITPTDQMRLRLHANNYEERLKEFGSITETKKDGDDVKGLEVAIQNVARYQAILGKAYTEMYEKYEKGEMSADRWAKFEERFYKLQSMTEERIKKLEDLDAQVGDRIDENRERVIRLMNERENKRVGFVDDVKERVNELKGGQSTVRQRGVTEQKDETPVRDPEDLPNESEAPDRVGGRR